MQRSFDAVILGGGAAGLFCAIEAAKRGVRTAVIEHNSTIGAKIRISGGGRCNFTNLNVSASDYVSRNPHFCKSALSRYTPNDIISLVESYHIEYYEKTKGQLFCTTSASVFIDMLLSECRKYNVTIVTACRTISVAYDTTDRIYTVDTTHGLFTAPSLVIATGGISISKLGASPFGYRIAEQFGHQIVPPKPALVPLLWNEADKEIFGTLSGISFEAIVTCGRTSIRDDVLLTHKGLSGPAILQISLYWNSGDVLEINLVPDIDIGNLLMLHRTEPKHPSVLLAKNLPKRFA